MEEEKKEILEEMDVIKFLRDEFFPNNTVLFESVTNGKNDEFMRPDIVADEL
jgi:hypothetical protein